jgi:hypothetical protein
MLATVMLSHDGDGAVVVTRLRRDEDTKSCWRRCHRVMLAMMLSGQLGRSAM